MIKFTKQNSIEFISQFHSYEHDFSWKINLADIRMIALAGRMKGDDDSLALVFTDKKGQSFPITLYIGLQGEENLISILKSQFSIDYHLEVKKFNIIGDANYIIYPKELYEKELMVYQKQSLWKLFLRNTHYALEKLTPIALDYLKIKE